MFQTKHLQYKIKEVGVWNKEFISTTEFVELDWFRQFSKYIVITFLQLNLSVCFIMSNNQIEIDWPLTIEIDWPLTIEILVILYLHLLNLVFPTGLFSKDGAGTVVKSSKLIIIKLMSSTSLLMGAMTSEHRNFEPKTNINNINHFSNSSVIKRRLNAYKWNKWILQFVTWPH